MSLPTKAQLTTILYLQGRLGASNRFVEPKFALGVHPSGWTLTAENAREIIAQLEHKLPHPHPHPLPV